jgi:hypothetical protein
MVEIFSTKVKRFYKFIMVILRLSKNKSDDNFLLSALIITSFVNGACSQPYPQILD